MAQISSIPPFPCIIVEKTGWRGLSVDVLVVRGTFHFGAAGRPMVMAEQQSPLSWGDTYSGPIATAPLVSTLLDIGDLVVGKPGTDIVVTGDVHSPGSKPVSEWLAGIRVGNLTKVMRVTGPRRFERTLLGWRATPAEQIEQVALDYRFAFGGHLNLPCDGEICALQSDENPVGIGWLPSENEIATLGKSKQKTLRAWLRAQHSVPAPQFENFQHPVRTPFSRLPPAGFGPIARWWQPRLRHQGTLGAKWLAERYPAPPEDYDLKFNQSSTPDLICTPHIRGDEQVVLGGCLPEKVETRLPGLALQAMTTFTNGTASIRPLVLDTVRFDLRLRQCTLTWRTIFDRTNPPADITVIALPLGSWDKVKAVANAGERTHA